MIARGDARRPTGLKSVYLAHRHDLVRFLRARGAGDAADDLVQELWLKLSQASVGPIADPLGYLYRAASNLMISRHRSAADLLGEPARACAGHMDRIRIW